MRFCACTRRHKYGLGHRKPPVSQKYQIFQEEEELTTGLHRGFTSKCSILPYPKLNVAHNVAHSILSMAFTPLSGAATSKSLPTSTWSDVIHMSEERSLVSPPIIRILGCSCVPDSCALPLVSPRFPPTSHQWRRQVCSSRHMVLILLALCGILLIAVAVFGVKGEQLNGSRKGVQTMGRPGKEGMQERAECTRHR